MRLDNNQVFYIGIGNKKRPYIKYGRSNFWKKIVSKSDYEIQILKSNLSKEDAIELEIILIYHYGRINNSTGVLCNLTDGGDGNFGMIVSEKTKKIKSDFLLKNPLRFWKNKKLSKEHVEKMIKNNGQAKKIICTVTGKIWSSVRQCALENNFNYSSFGQQINGIKKNKTTFKFLKDE
jgi:hypothetical protein